MDLGFDDLRGLSGRESAPVLRTLHWGEFCARLSAAQDLRRLSRMAPAGPPGGMASDGSKGSFHRSAAWLLHELSHEDLVNPNSSAIGKMEESTKVMKPSRPSPPPHGALFHRELP